jgi:hypothetical protein
MTDTTRVSAFKMSRDVSSRVFPASGVKTPFHALSHHSENPKTIAEFAKLNAYHVATLPYFFRKLKDTPDGDGNLLDHSLVLYGSPMGDSHVHEHKRVPVFLMGHANGAIKGNLHLRCPRGTSVPLSHPDTIALLTKMGAPPLLKVEGEEILGIIKGKAPVLVHDENASGEGDSTDHGQDKKW